MSLQSRLTTLVQAVGADIKDLFTKQGNLGALTTSAKSDLVAAINEVAASGGGGGSGPYTTLALSESVSDPSASTGQVILFAKLGSGTDSAVPYMTSANSPSGQASASEYYVNNAPWKGFAAPGNGWGWASNGSALPHWLKYQFPIAKTIFSYSVDPWDFDAFPQRCFKDFLLQGSNDDTNWTTLDTRSNVVDWVIGVAKYFDVTTSGSYLYYRLYVTANGGDAYVGTRHVRLIPGGVQLWAAFPDGSVAQVT